jgi:hypothetical protein
MSIQSCSRNPQHQMKNNMNNNHTIDSVANTVIPGQALEGVLITGQGQARAVPPPLLKITKIQMKVNCQTLLLLRISLVLIIMGIQSRSRNPRHQMNNNKNNKNNHIIHSVASTVIPGQALEDVPITSQGQAKAVPHRYPAQNLHHRLLEMKANLNPCHHHNRLGGNGFRKSVCTKPACESFYVHRTWKTTSMLASLFSPSGVFKPPDSCNSICNV